MNGPPEIPLMDWIGFEWGPDEPDGTGVATLAVTDQHLNPNGVVHGGVVFSIIDTMMGRATMAAVDDGNICASVEIHIRYLRGIPNDGGLTFRCWVERRGRRIVHLASDVVSDVSGKVVATATGTYAVIALEG